VSDHDLHDGLDEADDDLLARLRPPPPRTWRDRLDDLTTDPPPIGRVVAALAVVAVVAVVALRVLAPQSPPPEVDLPLAQPAGSEAAAAGGADPADAGGPAGGAPAGAAGGLDASGGGPAASGSPATASATEVVVHVVGAVAAPGVKRLPMGSRVVDAVDAAGGAAADADLARVNLAAVLVDGQQVVILRPGELPPSPVPAPSPGGATSGAASGGGVVNVNTASAAELEELPGVGPATAEAIIAHRDEHGPFTSVDDLLDVRGIGEAKLEQLRDRAAV
jgi:competence protein ComEA